MNQRRALRAVKTEADYGLTLDDLFADTLTFQVEVKGKPLDVTWAPARYTPDIEARAIALTSDDEDDEATNEARRGDRIRANQKAIRDVLAAVLIRWSLKTSTGVEVGTDEATLETLPSAFLDAVFTALWENNGPKAETDPPSESSS